MNTYEDPGKTPIENENENLLNSKPEDQNEEISIDIIDDSPKDGAPEITISDSPKINYDLEIVEKEDEEEESEEDYILDEHSDDINVVLLNIDEIISQLRSLAESDAPQRKDIDEAKKQFYRSLREDTEKQKALFIEEGGNEIDFTTVESPEYEEGKQLLQKIKEKRAVMLLREEKEKEKNVLLKLAVIEQLKQLIENPSHEDFNKTYQEFKTLQQQWSDIKLIPQSRANDLWKSFQIYVEKFYDLVRINNEFREYDFKKNYTQKLELCEAAERLDIETDDVSAFHQLQNLHQQWREIGPVARKDREEIWNRFKEASSKINKKYQAHFEKMKEVEVENLEKKTALCEKLEAIDYGKLATVKDWRNAVKEVLDLQAEWRQIGYVSRKWSSKVYNRYRAACDLFFKNKNDYYKSLREDMETNLQKKLTLCERAEGLKDNQDWKKTTQEMIEIQKEWKEIGMIPRRHVDTTWKRFITACDHFFEQKKLHSSSRYSEEANNLELKNSIVEKINNIDTSLPTEDALTLLRELMNEWHQVGFVPYKLKDTAHKNFNEAADKQFSRLNIDKDDRKLESFKSNISDMARSDSAKGQIYREREKLMRQYERMKNELQTYENNIGFLSVSSKKGNSLVDDLNQKVKKIKSEIDLIIKKINAIDDEI